MVKQEERPYKETLKRPEPIVEKKVEEVAVAPPPAENIWAKRKEERESQEKEKEKVPKSYQQAIEHHFPTVADTATMSIKVDKDLARRPVDTDFTRAALRARRVPVSNDVRNIIRNDDDRYLSPVIVSIGNILGGLKPVTKLTTTTPRGSSTTVTRDTLGSTATLANTEETTRGTSAIMVCIHT